MGKWVTEMDASELMEHMGEDSATAYMAVTGIHMVWSLWSQELLDIEREKLHKMFAGRNPGMVALAYTIIKEVYDKGKKEGEVFNG